MLSIIRQVNSFVLTADFADYADDWATKNRYPTSDRRPLISDLNDIRTTRYESLPQTPSWACRRRAQSTQSQ